MYFCNQISKKTTDEKDIIRWNALFDGMHVLHRATSKRRFCDGL
jgi:hypothetical protein